MATRMGIFICMMLWNSGGGKKEYSHNKNRTYPDSRSKKITKDKYYINILFFYIFDWEGEN